jgi:hypothetical protein
MDEVTWTVTEPNGNTSVQDPKEKHCFLKLIDIPSDMPEGQKTFALQFNSMREMLIKNGLMNKK